MIRVRPATSEDVELLRRWDATPHIIDPMASNTRARRFYERFGFRFVENRRYGDDEAVEP